MANRPCKNCIHEEACKTANPDMVKKTYQCKHYKSTADVVEVVRCKDCKFNVANMEKDPLNITDYSGDDIVCSYFMTDGLDPNDYCSRGKRTPKETGADKPKITCLNCKHLMFSDMYGECNKQLRIVKPSDTCEFAEPKERGGEK